MTVRRCVLLSGFPDEVECETHHMELRKLCKLSL